MESWDTLGGTWIKDPHAVSLGPHRLALFAVGIDHSVYCRWREGTRWARDWEPLPGDVHAITAPFAIGRGEQRLDLFVVNVDHRIHHRRWDGSGWSGWEDLFGEAGGPVITAPHGVSWGPDRLDLFVLGTDRSIWHKWWEEDRTSDDWDRIGWEMISPPHAVSSGPGRMDVFAVGRDGVLRHRAWRNGRWALEWESLEEEGSFGSITSIPHAVARESGRLDAFGLDGDRKLCQQVWERSWGPWRRIVGPVIEPPRALCWKSDRIDLFHVGTDAAVYHIVGDGEKWNEERSLRGQAFSPVSVVLQDEDLLELFVLGRDSAVWHQTVVAE